MAGQANDGTGGIVPPPLPKTGGGDSDNPGNGPDFRPGDGGMGKDRMQFIRDLEALDPFNLLGSWFHKLENGDMLWQGAVVAMLPGNLYVLQVNSIDIGADDVQIVVKADALVFSDEGYEWRFYDTEEKAFAAFSKWEAKRRERLAAS